MALLSGKNPFPTLSSSTAAIIPRSEHCISRKMVAENALKVLYRLRKSGYQAYLVGGCVRDLLLGREPKDFDVATNALPQEIKACFRNGRTIGKRFRLVHVLFKGEIIEVSTFRREHAPEQQEETYTEEGMILRDNVYGTLDDDANRRDFTLNALYYNIADFSVIDFHQGIQDLKQGIIRVIGDPITRYREDPVRMLRAVRFAAKLGFRIDPATEQPIYTHSHLLSIVSPHRLFNEILKIFLGENTLHSYKLLRHYKLFKYLFPETEALLRESDFADTDALLTQLFTDTDLRMQQGKTVSPAYLFAAILWHPLQNRIRNLKQDSYDIQTFNIAYSELLKVQQQAANIPRNFLMTVHTIWELQYRLENRKRHKCLELLDHPRFRAAYDFLLLRSKSGEKLDHLYQWWTNFYEGDAKTRKQLLNQLHRDPHKSRDSI